MTREQLKRVHVALEQCDGAIGPAASLLGLTPESLKKIIKQNPALQSYSPDAQPPSDTETLARPALPVVTREDEALAAAIERGDEQVRNGFKAIGVTGGALDEAMAFRDFGKHHWASMRHFVSGGVARLFATLMEDIQSVRKEIADPTVKADPDRERLLREDRSNLIKHALTTFDRLRQASLDAAVIEAKKAELKDGKSKKGRPAFAPLAMQVQGNVTIQEGKKEAAPESVKGQVPEEAAATSP